MPSAIHSGCAISRNGIRRYKAFLTVSVYMGTVSSVLYYAAGVPSSQVFGPTLVRGTNPNAVALTFDDGPSESTPAVLDVLAEHNAQATFFQLGANARRLPEMARRVAGAGHEIANHTETHPRFYLCSAAEIHREIETCQRTLGSIHGQAPRLFRPPYGARWFGLFPALDRLGLQAVMWSLSSRDWEDSEEQVAHTVTTRMQPGDVILMHDGDTTTSGDRRRSTARALGLILATLGGKGIRAVTVSDLFGIKA